MSSLFSCCPKIDRLLCTSCQSQILLIIVFLSALKHTLSSLLRVYTLFDLGNFTFYSVKQCRIEDRDGQIFGLMLVVMQQG
jgi:hypothetical protein